MRKDKSTNKYASKHDVVQIQPILLNAKVVAGAKVTELSRAGKRVWLQLRPLVPKGLTFN